MKPKLIFFDLDGTLLDGLEYSWTLLWEYFGIPSELHRAPIKKYLAGTITYQEWVDYDVKLLQDHGATKARITAAFANIKPHLGAIECLEELKKRGYKIFVISGGVDFAVTIGLGEHERLIDEIFINKLYFDKAGQLTHADATPYDLEHKATGIKEIAERHGVEPESCIFVGDNDNDVHAALAAGASIAFNSTSEPLIEAATHHIKTKDLRAILPLV